MSPSRKKLIEELFENIYTLKRKFVTDKRGATHHSPLPPSQWIVLLLVEQHPGIQVKEIATTLCMTSSAATQVIDNLVKKGYLKRKSGPSDRRTRTLELSEKSKKQMKQMKKDTLKKLSAMFDVLTDEELSLYLRLNKKIMNTI